MSLASIGICRFPDGSTLTSKSDVRRASIPSVVSDAKIGLSVFGDSRIAIRSVCGIVHA